jgi:hypothetical protein
VITAEAAAFPRLPRTAVFVSRFRNKRREAYDIVSQIWSLNRIFFAASRKTQDVREREPTSP